MFVGVYELLLSTWTTEVRVPPSNDPPASDGFFQGKIIDCAAGESQAYFLSSEGEAGRRHWSWVSLEEETKLVKAK